MNSADEAKMQAVGVPLMDMSNKHPHGDQANSDDAKPSLVENFGPSATDAPPRAQGTHQSPQTKEHPTDPKPALVSHVQVQNDETSHQTSPPATSQPSAKAVPPTVRIAPPAKPAVIAKKKGRFSVLQDSTPPTVAQNVNEVAPDSLPLPSAQSTAKPSALDDDISQTEPPASLLISAPSSSTNLAGKEIIGRTSPVQPPPPKNKPNLIQDTKQEQEQQQQQQQDKTGPTKKAHLPSLSNPNNTTPSSAPVPLPRNVTKKGRFVVISSAISDDASLGGSSAATAPAAAPLLPSDPETLPPVNTPSDHIEPDQKNLSTPNRQDLPHNTRPDPQNETQNDLCSVLLIVSTSPEEVANGLPVDSQPAPDSAPGAVGEKLSITDHDVRTSPVVDRETRPNDEPAATASRLVVNSSQHSNYPPSQTQSIPDLSGTSDKEKEPTYDSATLRAENTANIHHTYSQTNALSDLSSDKMTTNKQIEWETMSQLTNYGDGTECRDPAVTAAASNGAPSTQTPAGQISSSLMNGSSSHGVPTSNGTHRNLGVPSSLSVERRPIPSSMDASANGHGLGKIFYFLDQMKLEVTDADKTIRGLQSDMRFMREKNKELEKKTRELERRLREEKTARETAESKVRSLKKKVKDLKEVVASNLAVTEPKERNAVENDTGNDPAVRYTSPTRNNEVQEVPITNSRPCLESAQDTTMPIDIVLACGSENTESSLSTRKPGTISPTHEARKQNKPHHVASGSFDVGILSTSSEEVPDANGNADPLENIAHAQGLDGSGVKKANTKYSSTRQGSLEPPPSLRNNSSNAMNGFVAPGTSFPISNTQFDRMGSSVQTGPNKTTVVAQQATVQYQQPIAGSRHTAHVVGPTTSTPKTDELVPPSSSMQAQPQERELIAQFQQTHPLPYSVPPTSPQPQPQLKEVGTYSQGPNQKLSDSKKQQSSCNPSDQSNAGSWTKHPI